MSAVLAVLALAAGSGWAGEVDLSARVEQDLRYRIQDIPSGAWYAPVGVQDGFSRAETILTGRARARGSRVAGVADLSLVGSAFSSDLRTLGDVAQRRRVLPVNVELNALHFEIWDVLPGMDLRVGQQVVQWGVGDQFNPTNNLNADDLEDPLKFGRQLPNAMLRADWALGPAWTLSAVWVPIFRPALLPRTAGIGMAALDRLPMVEDDLRWRIHAEQAVARDWELLGYPTIVRGANPVLPDPSIGNTQAEVRLGGTLGLTDVALSYYTGRSDMPQPGRNTTWMDKGQRCHPDDDTDCIKGLLVTDVDLVYPRMQVAGFNAAGELSPLAFLGVERPLGWRLEAAVIFPERTVLELRNGELDLGALTQPAGEYDYQLGGERATVVEEKPFAKWTLGLDATLTKRLYLNGQWVHGLPDEFGAGDFLSEGWSVRAGGVGGGIEDTVDCAVVLQSGETCAWETLRYRIGDYAVLGADLTLNQTLVRLFGIVDMTGYVSTEWSESRGKRVQTRHSPVSEDGFSAVLYPEVTQNLGDGLTVSAGTLLMFGKNHTKFGDPAAGGNLVFARGAYSF